MGAKSLRRWERQAQGDGGSAVDEITGYLVPPSADEGFETTVYREA